MTRIDDTAIARESKRVVRNFQRYTSEERADRAVFVSAWAGVSP